MPAADGAVFLAPHPGQGRLLLGCIDPSVADEHDPLSVVPELDPFEREQRFRRAARRLVLRRRSSWRATAPRSATGSPASTPSPASTSPAPPRPALAAKQTGARRRPAALARTRIITVFRTDADPRTVDLSLDPNERPYGSLFGSRPDLINYGQVGFGRLTTPEAWLSTWSGPELQRRLRRAARPGCTVPTLFVELTGDQAAFPADSRAHGRGARRGRPDPLHGARHPLRRRRSPTASPPATSSPAARSAPGSTPGPARPTTVNTRRRDRRHDRGAERSFPARQPPVSP